MTTTNFRMRALWYLEGAKPLDELPLDIESSPSRSYVASGQLARDASADLTAAAEAIDDLHRRPAHFLPPDKCPPELVWRARDSRVWTGAGWLECGFDSVADRVVAAHNRVLSGLFGADGMP